MEKQLKNKIHVTSKLLVAVALQPLGIHYVCDEPCRDKEDLPASYQK